jgi:hypothetical protein
MKWNFERRKKWTGAKRGGEKSFLRVWVFTSVVVRVAPKVGRYL